LILQTVKHQLGTQATQADLEAFTGSDLLNGIALSAVAPGYHGQADPRLSTIRWRKLDLHTDKPPPHGRGARHRRFLTPAQRPEPEEDHLSPDSRSPSVPAPRRWLLWHRFQREMSATADGYPKV